MLIEPYRRHSPGQAVAVASLIALTQIGTAIGYASGSGPRTDPDPGQKPRPEQDRPA
jgi:hypothetical protein